MLKYMVDGNQLAAVVVFPTGAAPSPAPPLELPLEPPLDPPLEPPLDPPLDPPLELPLDPPLDPPLELLLPSGPAEASAFDELDPPPEFPHAVSATSDRAAARTTFRMGRPPRERWKDQAYRGPVLCTRSTSSHVVGQQRSEDRP
jgi:hypothetical protein